MTQLIRPVGYTGAVQTLTIPENFGSTFTAHLWGAGGGGGGGDSIGPVGGRGTGGGYSRVTVAVNAGDVISIAVGGAGGGGLGQRSSAAGGAAGTSYVADQVYNLANQSGLVRVSHPAWCAFLNTYGVWGVNAGRNTLQWNNNVYFPFSGYYTFTSSCDNTATIYLDGATVLTAPGYGTTYSASVFVNAGTRNVAVYALNTGGPSGVALTVDSGTSYSGANGGRAGAAGSSGGGGGAGGATVLFLNGTAVAVAGGGGGGGGAGQNSGQSSPGSRGQSIESTAGQKGQNKDGDGGGGGGGGGGRYGGNGGSTNGGDSGANAGVNGSSSGDIVSNPSGITPGGIDTPYYSGTPGYGGKGSNQNGAAGSSGYAVFEFNVAGLYINNSGTFTSVDTTYVKNNDVWAPVQAVWIKNAGIWNQVQGGSPPLFTSVSGNFGINPRVYG